MSSSAPSGLGERRNSAILVTGAGGEVGHGLIHALHAAGRHNIVAIDIRELPADLRGKCQRRSSATSATSSCSAGCSRCTRSA